MSTLNRFYYESPDEFRYYFDGRLQSHTNLGIPPLKFIEDYGPNQNGSTVRDWRINPRKIALDIFLQGDYCCGTRGEQLAELINIIRPNRGEFNNSPGWLRFTNDNWKMMEIPVQVLQGPSGDFDYNGAIGKWQVSDAVQFYAADPIWREYGVQSISVTQEDAGSCLDIGCLSSDLPGLIVEGDFCLTAETFIQNSVSVPYTGTWDADQINIRLVGKMFDPRITNATLNKTIELDYDIPTGDYVDITIRSEFVTVIDNHGTNLIGSITSISDLVDFVFKSPGEITPTGVNEITFSAVESDSNSSITLDYWTRHISAYGSPECDNELSDPAPPPLEEFHVVANGSSITPLIEISASSSEVPSWRIVESDGSEYLYNLLTFTHNNSASGNMDIYLGGSVLPDVTRLDMSSSHLIGITDVSLLSNIESLRLQDNSLVSVGSISGLTKIEQIILWGNQLTELDSVTNLTTLTWLDISFNYITSIGTVDNLINLDILYVNSNLLSDIGNVDNVLPGLLDFRVYDNANLTTSVELGRFGADLYTCYTYNTQCITTGGTTPMTCLDVADINTQASNLNQTNVDDILRRIWTDRALFNAGFHRFVSILNAQPSGIYQAAVVPSTGKEYAYDLVNDSNGEGFQTWIVNI